MNTSYREPSAKERQVEEFWRSRVDSFDFEDERRICDAYMEHIIGTDDYEEMGLVHAGVREGKGDYSGFYDAISDVIHPSVDELEVLVSEGFEWAGFMFMLTKDCEKTAPYAWEIIGNMVVFK
ncbi:hypothetical protein HOD75_02165 [archaeon]|jgi:hypothetical protein|nr:hypothetical protein [archaeon]MBT4241682.1 hypothetical protein [archaeon]MBT4418077.1 hypothetical protein [archaeon]